METPMLKQYQAIKSQHRDAILFFRLGDFYEMFLDDATVASKELELTLTGRGKDENRIPMCGVPFHAAENYIAKLVGRGFKVAICEQVEDPALAKGLTKREVVRVVTPGTQITQLDESETNYVAAVGPARQGEKVGVSFIDISTGEFRLFLADSAADADRLNAREKLSDADFEGVEHAQSELQKFVSLSGLEACRAAFPAAWAVLKYVRETQKSALPQITRLLPFQLADHLLMDAPTLKNLELTESAGFSLFKILDQTKTAMGARRLKFLLRNPLIDETQINARLDAVENLFHDLLSREEIRHILSQVYDLERLVSRIVSGHHNPRDAVALRDSLSALSELYGVLRHLNADLLKNFAGFFYDFQRFAEILDLLKKGIVDEPSANLRDGRLIREGFSEELDELVLSFKTVRDWIAGLEDSERTRTGIKSLKVGFNKVFGYFIAITNSQAEKVPADYIRKQTLANAERYITPELKEKENILLNGEERQKALEAQLYEKIVSEIQKFVVDFQELARIVGDLDCLQSLASVSQKNQYARPQFSPGKILEIENGRHPVIEKNAALRFIPNDVRLNQETRFILLTGPNMAGKSTVMRQVALTVVLAQIGCFVPASKARLSVVDKLFTRIGASDNLSLGQSTFMVEMLETASILNHASENSLILLDEIGRGTSTFDGMSLAYAISEHVHQKIGARTFFATHYHELSELEKQLPGLKNFNMEIQERDGKLVFSYKLTPGPASKSYGIHVAEMAGLPDPVIVRAKEILGGFEQRSAGQLRLF